MKPLFGMIAGAVLLLSSCATSNEVNGGGIFQKRKYNKGFYWNKGVSNETIARAESGKFEAETETIFKSEIAQNETVQASDITNSQELNSKPSTSIVHEKKSADDLQLFSEAFNSRTETFSTINPVKKLAQAQSNTVKKVAAKAKAPRNNGQLGYLIGVVLLVILLLLLFTVLDAILGGLLSWILRIVILVIIIVLILRLLGII